MARRPNYGFQKHQKEMKKQRKKEAKMEKKRLKAEAAEQGDSSVEENPDVPGDDSSDESA